MSASHRRFSQEFKDELCREVIDTSKPIRGAAELDLPLKLLPAGRRHTRIPFSRSSS